MKSSFSLAQQPRKASHPPTCPKTRDLSQGHFLTFVFDLIINLRIAQPGSGNGNTETSLAEVFYTSTSMLNWQYGFDSNTYVILKLNSTGGSARIMVSTPYTRGRSHEYQVLRKLRADGWLCSRSAASHGPVDIFAGKEGQLLLVQVKSGKGRATDAEREILRIWGKAFQGRVEIWKFRKGKPLEREVLCDHRK